jgi:hypothetical protein
MGILYDMGYIFPILLRIFIVSTIWVAVWYYMQPKKADNRLMSLFVLVIALLFAAGLISMTN